MSQNVNNRFENTNFNGTFHQNNFNVPLSIEQLSDEALEEQLLARRERVRALRSDANRASVTLFVLALVFVVVAVVLFLSGAYGSIQEFMAVLLEGVAVNAAYACFSTLVLGLVFGGLGLKSVSERPALQREKEALRSINREISIRGATRKQRSK